MLQNTSRMLVRAFNASAKRHMSLKQSMTGGGGRGSVPFADGYKEVVMKGQEVWTVSLLRDLLKDTDYKPSKIEDQTHFFDFGTDISAFIWNDKNVLL